MERQHDDICRVISLMPCRRQTSLVRLAALLLVVDADDLGSREPGSKSGLSEASEFHTYS